MQHHTLQRCFDVSTSTLSSLHDIILRFIETKPPLLLQIHSYEFITVDQCLGIARHIGRVGRRQRERQRFHCDVDASPTPCVSRNQRMERISNIQPTKVKTLVALDLAKRHRMRHVPIHHPSPTRSSERSTNKHDCREILTTTTELHKIYLDTLKNVIQCNLGCKLKERHNQLLVDSVCKLPFQGLKQRHDRSTG
jgi:hypothetical protein